MAAGKRTRIYTRREPLGERFGRLIVIELVRDAPRARNRLWLCRCDCGAERRVLNACLLSGHVQSCGCLKIDRATKHGMSKSAEFHTWQGMQMRCYNESDKSYPRYGGRGIVVCGRWRESFEEFYADMGPRPSPRHSLDRIDNDGPYSPENCRWATPKQQTRNRRTNRRYEFNGRTLTIPEWSEVVGIDAGVLRMRLRSGWPIEKAFATPVMWRGPRASRIPRPGGA